MPEFAFSARNLQGQDVSGLISAETKRDVFNLLKERSLFPLSVEEAAKGAFSISFRRGIKPELLSNTLTQLADLLRNGVPLLRSIDVLAAQATHPMLSDVLFDLRRRVSDGEQLNDAMAAHPEVFSELTINIVRAGTEGAFLEESLEQTAAFLERQEELRSRVRSAMAYPAFLAGAGSLVTVVLIVFFVPKFAELFAQLEQAGTLPAATIALLFLSDVLGRYGLLVAAGLAGVVYGVRRWMQTEAGRLLVDRWKIRIPVFGSIFLNGAVSRFCRILGTLLKNGVPILQSLKIARDSAGNRILADIIEDATESVRKGATLSKPLGQSNLFPLDIVDMIAIGEESNNLENVLVTIADSYEARTSRKIELAVRMLEPLLLVGMAGVVAIIAVALLLPILTMSAGGIK